MGDKIEGTDIQPLVSYSMKGKHSLLYGVLSHDNALICLSINGSAKSKKAQIHIAVNEAVEKVMICAYAKMNVCSYAYYACTKENLNELMEKGKANDDGREVRDERENDDKNPHKIDLDRDHSSSHVSNTAYSVAINDRYIDDLTFLDSVPPAGELLTGLPVTSPASANADSSLPINWKENALNDVLKQNEGHEPNSARREEIERERCNNAIRDDKADMELPESDTGKDASDDQAQACCDVGFSQALDSDIEPDQPSKSTQAQHHNAHPVNGSGPVDCKGNDLCARRENSESESEYENRSRGHVVCPPQCSQKQNELATNDSRAAHLHDLADGSVSPARKPSANSDPRFTCTVGSSSSALASRLECNKTMSKAGTAVTAINPPPLPEVKIEAEESQAPPSEPSIQSTSTTTENECMPAGVARPFSYSGAVADSENRVSETPAPNTSRDMQSPLPQLETGEVKSKPSDKRQPRKQSQSSRLTCKAGSSPSAVASRLECSKTMSKAGTAITAINPRRPLPDVKIEAEESKAPPSEPSIQNTSTTTENECMPAGVVRPFSYSEAVADPENSFSETPSPNTSHDMQSPLPQVESGEVKSKPSDKGEQVRRPLRHSTNLAHSASNSHASNDDSESANSAEVIVTPTDTESEKEAVESDAAPTENSQNTNANSSSQSSSDGKQSQSSPGQSQTPSTPSERRRGRTAQGGSGGGGGDDGDDDKDKDRSRKGRGDGKDLWLEEDSEDESELSKDTKKSPQLPTPPGSMPDSKADSSVVNGVCKTPSPNISHDAQNPPPQVETEKVKLLEKRDEVEREDLHLLSLDSTCEGDVHQPFADLAQNSSNSPVSKAPVSANSAEPMATPTITDSEKEVVESDAATTENTQNANANSSSQSSSDDKPSQPESGGNTTGNGGNRGNGDDRDGLGKGKREEEVQEERKDGSEGEEELIILQQEEGGPELLVPPGSFDSASISDPEHHISKTPTPSPSSRPTESRFKTVRRSTSAVLLPRWIRCRQRQKKCNKANGRHTRIHSHIKAQPKCPRNDSNRPNVTESQRSQNCKQSRSKPTKKRNYCSSVNPEASNTTVPSSQNPEQQCQEETNAAHSTRVYAATNISGPHSGSASKTTSLSQQSCQNSSGHTSVQFPRPEIPVPLVEDSSARKRVRKKKHTKSSSPHIQTVEGLDDPPHVDPTHDQPRGEKDLVCRFSETSETRSDVAEISVGVSADESAPEEQSKTNCYSLSSDTALEQFPLPEIPASLVGDSSARKNVRKTKCMKPFPTCIRTVEVTEQKYSRKDVLPICKKSLSRHQQLRECSHRTAERKKGQGLGLCSSKKPDNSNREDFPTVVADISDETSTKNGQCKRGQHRKMKKGRSVRKRDVMKRSGRHLRRSLSWRQQRTKEDSHGPLQLPPAEDSMLPVQERSSHRKMRKKKHRKSWLLRTDGRSESTAGDDFPTRRRSRSQHCHPVENSHRKVNKKQPGEFSLCEGERKFGMTYGSSTCMCNSIMTSPQSSQSGQCQRCEHRKGRVRKKNSVPVHVSRCDRSHSVTTSPQSGQCQRCQHRKGNVRMKNVVHVSRCGRSSWSISLPDGAPQPPWVSKRIRCYKRKKKKKNKKPLNADRPPPTAGNAQHNSCTQDSAGYSATDNLTGGSSVGRDSERSDLWRQTKERSGIEEGCVKGIVSPSLETLVARDTEYEALVRGGGGKKIGSSEDTQSPSKVTKPFLGQNGEKRPEDIVAPEDIPGISQKAYGDHFTADSGYTSNQSRPTAPSTADKPIKTQTPTSSGHLATITETCQTCLTSTPAAEKPCDKNPSLVHTTKVTSEQLVELEQSHNVLTTAEPLAECVTGDNLTVVLVHASTNIPYDPIHPVCEEITQPINEHSEPLTACVTTLAPDNQQAELIAGLGSICTTVSPSQASVSDTAPSFPPSISCSQTSLTDAAALKSVAIECEIPQNNSSALVVELRPMPQILKEMLVLPRSKFHQSTDPTTVNPPRPLSVRVPRDQEANDGYFQSYPTLVDCEQPSELCSYDESEEESVDEEEDVPFVPLSQLAHTPVEFIEQVQLEEAELTGLDESHWVPPKEEVEP